MIFAIFGASAPCAAPPRAGSRSAENGSPQGLPRQRRSRSCSPRGKSGGREPPGGTCPPAPSAEGGRSSLFLRGRIPEGSFPPAEFFKQLPPLGLKIGHPGDVIVPRAGPVVFDAPQLGTLAERQDGLLGSRGEFPPSPNVLFRPEEIHSISDVGLVLEPFGVGHVHVGADGLRLGEEELAVTHIDAE